MGRHGNWYGYGYARMSRERFTEQLLWYGFAVVESTTTAITYTKTIPESIVEDYPDRWTTDAAMDHEIRSQACGVHSLANCNEMSPFVVVEMHRNYVKVIVTKN